MDAVLDSGDLLDLLIGSEGTLGFITALECRLAPLPGATAGLRIALRSLDDLADVVNALLPLRPAALEMLDSTFLELVAREGGRVPALARGADAILLVEFERATEAGARGAVGDAVRAVSAWTSEVETAITPEDAEELWAIRHAASPILARLPATHRSMQVIEDGAVPVSRLAEYVRLVRRVTRAHGLGAVIFGHAGDGNIHVNLLVDTTQAGWEARVTIGVAGGVGRHRGPRRHPERRARRRPPPGRCPGIGLRAGADCPLPRHQGRLRPGGNPQPRHQAPRRRRSHRPAQGRRRPPRAIPDDIALALRDIERTGGYARARLELAP